MEAVCPSEVLITVYQTTWRHILGTAILVFTAMKTASLAKERHQMGDLGIYEDDIKKRGVRMSYEFMWLMNCRFA
jgi:hypothetical protein